MFELFVGMVICKKKKKKNEKTKPFRKTYKTLKKVPLPNTGKPHVSDRFSDIYGNCRQEVFFWKQLFFYLRALTAI